MAVRIVNAPYSLCASGNPIVYTVQSTLSGEDGFDLLADVVVGETVIARLRLYPNDLGQADLDISKLVHDRKEALLPDLNNSQPHLLPDGVFRYQVNFFEYINGEQKGADWDGVHYAVRSTVPDSVPYFEDFIREHYYLTNAPQIQETNAGGVHYLYFFSCAKAQYRLKCRAYSHTGETAEIVLSPDFETVLYGLYALPVGLFHKKISVPGRLEKYTVWLETVSAPRPVGRSFTFRLADAVRTKKTLVYENVYGGLDTVFYAERKEVLKVTREKQKIGRAQRSHLVEWANSLECSSGFISKKMVEMYKHFLISDRCYVVGDDGFLSAVIEGDTFPVVDEKEDLIEIGFTMTPGTATLFRRFEEKRSMPGEVPLQDVLGNDIATGSGNDVYVNKEQIV